MKVAVNLLWLVPGRVGGSEAYARRVLAALPDDIEVFALPTLARELDASRPNVTVAPVDGRKRPVRVVAESTWLALQVRNRGVDVVHHMGGTVPPGAAVAPVLTVHDLLPLQDPSQFGVVKRHYLAAALPRSIRAARVVLTPSEYVRRTVLERFDLDEAAVVAAPAPAPPASGRAPGADLIGHPYVLYPAITYPHKNHAVLVRAMASVDPEIHLVCCGGEGPAEADVAALVAAHGLGDRFHRLGRVSDTALADLYWHALAVVFPSLHEGFGLPVVEAMANRRPVIAADATALPEVVGDAGVLVPPDDPAAWAKAVDDLAGDPALRHALADRGLARLDRYTAAACQEVHLRAYQAAAS